ncbi:MAG: YegS/Rv2252/BmrU family lipid kinase [Ruminococcus sp.]|nr:YegS/Rv2252/BmrU family lipid kinase [Ruminococcus sp.]
MKKLLFVYNPHAGKGQIKNNLCEIVDIFTKGGYEVTAYPTQAPRDGYRKITEDGDNYDLICTSGGDGTLSEAVKALMTFDYKIPLGYIPAGSTNDVAQSLGIPTKMAYCAKSIMEGVDFDYDIGEFNGENFVYVAGFGAFTDVSYETPQYIKNILGHAAYVAEGLKRINKIQGYEMTVEHDGEVISGNFILGLISNSLSIAGMKKLVADGVCFDDGLFEVCLVKTPKNILELNSLLTEAALNKLTNKNFVTFKTSSLKITSKDSIAWTLDGEAGGNHTEVEIKNIKQAVRFRLGLSEITAEQDSVRQSLTETAEGVMSTADGRPVVPEDQSDIEV